MPSWLTDPFTIFAVASVSLVALGFGLVRREPPWAICGAMVGVASFMLAYRWAGHIGQGAEVAVSLAGVGAALWTMSAERVRARRRNDATQQSPLKAD